MPIIARLPQYVKLPRFVKAASRFHRFAHLCYNGREEAQPPWLPRVFPQSERPDGQGGDL